MKRKGLDLLIAVDTSRSMLSNDVQPNRLERVKLATQDLINELQGDRVGLIAFAGRAFVQAPLTIDYDAVVEAINDLDTNTIPEGGTNISEAITLAEQTYGKSAVGNRALVIFTDGEELSGDAVKTAKAAADAGVRIFHGGRRARRRARSFRLRARMAAPHSSKIRKGQVVKSKLDEKRLREIAQATGGFYLHLENGPRTMQQLFTKASRRCRLARSTCVCRDGRSSATNGRSARRSSALAMSMLIGERKRVRATVSRRPATCSAATATAALFLICLSPVFASAPGLESYRGGKFNDAYQEFQQTLKSHPQTNAADKLQFDSGAAAYKMKDYGKALESFSQALLSPDLGLQSKSHYNLGNTLYERGEAQHGDEKKLADWTNALQHYEETLKLDPQNKEAKENYEYVKKKIEELKNKKQQQPSPTPPPQNKQQKNDKKDQQKDQQQSQQDRQQQQQQQDQQQQSQSQNKPGTGTESETRGKGPVAGEERPAKKSTKPGRNPSRRPPNNKSEPPSPSPGEGKNDQQDRQPSPGQKQAEESPTPGEREKETPSPSPGEGEGSPKMPTPIGHANRLAAEEIRRRNKGAIGGKTGQTAGEKCRGCRSRTGKGRPDERAPGRSAFAIIKGRRGAGAT